MGFLFIIHTKGGNQPGNQLGNHGEHTYWTQNLGQCLPAFLKYLILSCCEQLHIQTGRIVSPMKKSVGDEALPRKISVHADGPVHLPHHRPPHQHFLRALPLWECHTAGHICVSWRRDLWFRELNHNIFSIQDVCLVFSLIIVFLSFFSTYVFQAGLVGLLVSRYKVPIMISITYLGLSIGYHVSSLNTRWWVVREVMQKVIPDCDRYEPQSYWWTDSLLALFVLHRFGEIQSRRWSES